MALTTIPAAGAPIRGSVLSALITEVRLIEASMTSDQALTASTTTLQNITSLVLACEANANYYGYAVLMAANASGTTEDVKYGFTFPTGATLTFNPIGPAVAVTAADGDGAFNAAVQATSGTTTRSIGAVGGGVYTTTFIPFRLTVGANAGNLQVQAAQNTSGLNVTTIRLHSRILMQRYS